MAPPPPSILLAYTAALFSFTLSAAAAASVCPVDSSMFLCDLRSQCPLSISPVPVLEVNGHFLERALTAKERNDYISVFFYASWCPFSRSMLPKFEMLGAMFPHIEHFAVEQSLALPSVFSRYGVHSLPSILIVNQTMKVRYRGTKNLQSLVHFYEKITGFEPVTYLAEDEQTNFEGGERAIMQPWDGSPLEEIMKRETYLVLATSFLCLRILVFLSPKLLSHIKAFYCSYVPHFNLEIFGETSQLFGRILHLVDVRRIWTKLRLCKIRNFQERAKNFRLWASSLTSVSLGESSSSARS